MNATDRNKNVLDFMAYVKHEYLLDNTPESFDKIYKKKYLLFVINDFQIINDFWRKPHKQHPKLRRFKIRFFNIIVNVTFEDFILKNKTDTLSIKFKL